MKTHTTTKPKPLTCNQALQSMKAGTAVKLVIYTGERSTLGYSLTKEACFSSTTEAIAFADNAPNFNLYGWNGRHWSSDALPA